MGRRNVVVIGRGIAGLSAARALCFAGFDVTLAGPPLESGVASYTSQGVSTIKGLLYARGQLFQAKLAGHRFLRSWLDIVQKESNEILFSNFAKVIEPFETEQDHQRLRSRIYKLQWSGAHRVALVGPHQSLAGVTYPMALCHPGDGFVEQKSLLTGLLKSSISFGVRVISDEVTGLSVEGAAPWSVALASGACLNADEVVVAAGGGSLNLLESIGCKLKIRRSVGMTYSWCVSDQSEQQAYLFGKSSLVLNRGVARLGSWEAKGKSMSNEELLAQENMISKDAADRFPSLTPINTSVPALRWGLRVSGGDGFPLIGEMPIGSRRLFLLTGFHKSGLQLAPMAAEMLAIKMRGGHSQNSFWDGFLPNRSGVLAKN